MQLFIVEKDNKYGHPSLETMSKLESNGIEIHRTDECGNIVYKSTGSGVTTACTVKGSYESDNKTEELNEVNKYNTTSNTQSSSSGSVTTNEPASNERIVYWIPNGKSYYYNRNCGTLSRSKTILEGYGSEFPKTDLCNISVK